MKYTWQASYDEYVALKEKSNSPSVQNTRLEFELKEKIAKLKEKIENRQQRLYRELAEINAVIAEMM